jgi:hypothetical protein
VVLRIYNEKRVCNSYFITKNRFSQKLKRFFVYKTPLSVVCSKAIAGVLRILNEKEFVTLALFIWWKTKLFCKLAKRNKSAGGLSIHSLARCERVREMLFQMPISAEKSNYFYPIKK